MRNWRDDAACLDTSPEFWFPEEAYGSPVEAKRICATCSCGQDLGKSIAWDSSVIVHTEHRAQDHTDGSQ